MACIWEHTDCKQWHDLWSTNFDQQQPYHIIWMIIISSLLLQQTYEIQIASPANFWLNILIYWCFSSLERGQKWTHQFEERNILNGVNIRNKCNFRSQHHELETESCQHTVWPDFSGFYVGLSMAQTRSKVAVDHFLHYQCVIFW